MATPRGLFEFIALLFAPARQPENGGAASPPRCAAGDEGADRRRGSARALLSNAELARLLAQQGLRVQGAPSPSTGALDALAAQCSMCGAQNAGIA